MYSSEVKLVGSSSQLAENWVLPLILASLVFQSKIFFSFQIWALVYFLREDLN